MTVNPLHEFNRSLEARENDIAVLRGIACGDYETADANSALGLPDDFDEAVEVAKNRLAEYPAEIAGKYTVAVCLGESESLTCGIIDGERLGAVTYRFGVISGDLDEDSPLTEWVDSIVADRS